MPDTDRTSPPPILTILTEFCTWAMERTADFPKPQRHTLAEKLDRTALDAMELTIVARFATRKEKSAALGQLNVKLEVLRCFWRVALERRFISQQQAVFLNGRLDEIGRMAGAWLRSIEKVPQ